MTKYPKLSIIVLTYNLQAYIAEALDSIIMQQVNFNYRLLVFDDASTDDTRQILLNYKKEHPFIELFFAKENVGFQMAMIFSSHYVDSEYWIILDGDDYYVDDKKLQKQVDFLDNNPDYIGCVHNVEILSERNQKRTLLLEKQSVKYNDIIKRNGDLTTNGIVKGIHYLQTSSQMFRTIKPVFPKQLYGNIGDWTILIFYAAYRGRIRYIDEVMSCYRDTQKGDWTSRSEFEQYFGNIMTSFFWNHQTKFQYNKDSMRSVIGYIILKIRPLPKLSMQQKLLSIIFVFFAINMLVVKKDIKIKVLHKILTNHNNRFSYILKIFFHLWYILLWLKVYPVLSHILYQCFYFCYILPKFKNRSYWKMRWYQFWKSDVYKKISN
ncbi:MAG: glycosyltransferase [Alphaproteobacteria bacterium]|nr:glycosyltransferase [Alphaproteobacteria bacterium]